MSDWPPESFELCKGPLDGAVAKRKGKVMPQVIFAHTILANGIVLWEREKCCDRACRYIMDGFKFVFHPEK